MEKTLAGRIAFVTGSGRGLGRAIAERLAELGADVAIHDLSEEAPAKYGESPTLSAVAGELRRHGGRVTAVTGDIGEPGRAVQMEAAIGSELGPIDILVNCAGGDIGAQGTKPDPNDALHVSYEDIRALINNNLIGTMLVTQAVGRGMVERKRGSIVNIASVAAHFGTSPEVTYSSIKAAIVHYTRCLAFELRPHGVRVNAVSPGPTKTARFVATRKVDPAMMDERNALVRYAKPGEIADAVAFFAGDASRFVHGQVLRVDGGMTLYAG
jgi:NAD(P)-dependent dehydrogenase (short-subunit alcohol dehydrogenase family)